MLASSHITGDNDFPNAVTGNIASNQQPNHFSGVRGGLFVLLHENAVSFIYLIFNSKYFWLECR